MQLLEASGDNSSSDLSVIHAEFQSIDTVALVHMIPEIVAPARDLSVTMQSADICVRNPTDSSLPPFPAPMMYL